LDGRSGECGRYWRYGVVAGLVAVLGWAAMACHAEDVAPFRLTGVEGYATTRFLRDEIVTSQPGAGADSRESQSDLRGELFVMTHSYVYHPNFLSLDIGGGPILQRQDFAIDSSDTQSSGALYNFTGRATFLREKPYRGSVFYDHLNPTLSVAPGQVLTQENTSYGFDFALLAPVTPVPLYVDATRSHFQGRGVDRVIDDQVDRVNLRASRSFGALGSTQLQYQDTRQESLSGSPNLQVQASSASTQGFNADSRFQFGANRQYDLVNLVTLNAQSYALGQGPFPDRRDARFFLDLRARHTDTLQTFADYNYSTSSQGDIASTLNSASAGLSYWPTKDLSATFGLRGENNQTNQFSTHSYGVDGSGRYQRALSLGVAQANYGFRYDHRDQVAVANQTDIIGERVTLVGTTFNALSHQRVIAASVVVNNGTRTQTFVEGFDYTLTVVGLETRVQRVIGGNIVDGQEVLVDYSYDVGGTYAYAQTDQTFNVNWGLSNYVNVYFRYFDSAPHLISGAPSFPLNTVRSSLYGARADIPLRVPFEPMVGGSFESEDRRETVSPYRREAEDFYIQAEEPLFGTGNFRLSTRRMRVDYASSIQDVNLIGYDFRYWSRHWFGLDVSLDGSYERDTGGPVLRRRVIGSAKAQWRYRKATLTLDLARTRETQGTFERGRTLFQLLGRRDF
jgi:hypothetical protein